MRIIDMRPEITPFKDGVTKKVGKWSYRDTLGFSFLRVIFHYDTEMGYYQSRDGEAWDFIPVSIGHGSVSDQGGMNQLMSVQYDWQSKVVTNDYGYRYLRDNKGGGARIEDCCGLVVMD